MILLAQITAQTHTVAQTSIGLGSAIALAGILSWLYVLYFAATRTPDERR
jgi:hypothetical protein